MKLSFSIPSKTSSSSKPLKINDAKNDTVPSKHFLTEFDPSKPPSTLQQPTVIPPIQNQWRPLKKMKNLDLPITDPNAQPQSLQFEHDTSAATGAEPGSHMSYGLNLRQSAQENSDDDGSGGGGGETDDGDRAPRQRPEAVLLQKFKDDLKRLPDDRGFEEFDDVPVEGFGKALLAGYGWSEGMGIGKNAKEDVKVVEYKRRTAKEGLGFIGDDHRSKKKAAAGAENGRDGGDFVAVEKKKKEEDKVVRIVGGRDAGLKGSVVKRIGEDWVVLKVLRKSGEGVEVRVKVDDVAELGSVEEEKCLRKLRELRIQHHDYDDGDRGKDKSAKGSKNKRGRGRGEVEEMKLVDVNGDRRKEEQKHGEKQVSWLASHIRVRVISRDFKGGRLYLKKGKVLDVVGPMTCDISMDESKEIVQGVSQDILETALPRRGGLVLVLSGKYKGAYGSLVERDLDREIGIVKDADTHELFNVRLDHIAEYIGDPSLLGH